jgi:hypothetical protein
MKVVGNATMTGRGKKFVKKNYKEDDWAVDESFYLR